MPVQKINAITQSLYADGLVRNLNRGPVAVQASTVCNRILQWQTQHVPILRVL